MGVFQCNVFQNNVFQGPCEIAVVVPEPQPAGGRAPSYQPPRRPKGFRRRIQFLEQELLDALEEQQKLETRRTTQESKARETRDDAVPRALLRTIERLDALKPIITQLELAIAQEQAMWQDDEDAMQAIMSALH